MSVRGQKRSSNSERLMSALPSTADIKGQDCDAGKCQYRKSGVTKLPERHLVPSTLIRQNGRRNYMKWDDFETKSKIAIYPGKQGRCAMADDEPLKNRKTFPFTRIKSKS
jgi:hypothetical protein